MPRKSKRADHGPLPFPVGAGLFRSGDFAKIPPGTTPYMKNLAVRPGHRVEKRPGWLRDASIDGTMATIALASYQSDSSSTGVLVVGGGMTGKSGYRNNDGTYSLLTSLFSIKDSVNFLNKLYMTHPITDSTIGSVDSFDGTTLTANAINCVLAGNTISSFNSRLYLGAIREKPVNQVVSSAAYKFEDNTVWTKAGGPPTVAVAGTIRTVTIVGSSDTLKTTNAVYTSGSTEEYIQVVVAFRSANTSSMPFTVTVEDSAGTTVYGKLDLLVADRTSNPDWQTYAFPRAVLIPASTAVYVKYAPGSSTLAAVTGAVQVADSANNRGLVVTKGRRTFISTPVGTGITLFGNSFPYRFVWSEVNDPTYWRSTSYYDCKEVPGEITVIRSGNGKLLVFKKDAIWTFIPQDNPDLPISFAGLLTNVGCVAAQAIKFFANTFYFVGENEVYEWSGDGMPTPLAGEAMRETLFADPVGAAILAVDEQNHDVWVTTNSTDIWIFNTIERVWSGPYTVTGPSDSSLIVNDFTFVQPRGESSREMWATLNESVNVVKLRKSQTYDNPTGTNYDVTTEYWLRPVETDPKATVYVETIDIDHKITGDQTGSTTTYRVSFDGGTTWDAENAITVAPLASGDYQPMTVDLWQSDERMTIAIKHTGKAGPTYFNFSGASAMVQVLGERIQRTNPTQGSSNL